MKSLVIGAVSFGAALPASADQLDQPVAHVGVVDAPCAQLPPMPEVVADYLRRAQLARAANRTLPAPSAEGLAIYNSWQRELLVADFSGLCRYRDANRDLPQATGERVIFFGDSITEGWSTQNAGFFTGDRINRGISGQTTTQMLGRFRADVIALDPAVVHILAGTNDIAGNTGPTSLEAIEDNIRSMVELARAHSIAVVIGAVLPARRFDWRPGIEPVQTIEALNGRLRALAAREGLCFADYHAALDDGAGGIAPANAADGVHPTAAGYALMGPIAERALARALQARSRRNARCAAE